MFPIHSIDLRDIRYHFTPCGKVGRFGPTYQACIEHYTASNSRLSQPGLLLQSINTKAGVIYDNAQLFVVPHFGLYNITVAGASGARGVCNIEQGHGHSRTVQVELYSNMYLLVLVGQRGLGFCDMEPSSTPCENRPQDLPSAIACNDIWYTYLEDEFDEHSVETLGGGGGGGASMIRAFTRQGFNPEPTVVGGGGGGTSALLQYDIVNMIGVNTTGTSSDLAYRSLINAKSSSSGYNALFWGRRTSSAFNTAGLGGEYSNNNQNRRLSVDGGYLRRSRDFAVGGLDCNDALTGACGGFGGGGGACAGGGGGGGYLGGSVLGEGRTIPGGGGQSVTGSPFRTSFKLIRFIEDKLNSEPDGYVDIIDADCECIFKCEVYYDDDQFECTCPGNTLLAPDGSDCYTCKLS